MKFNQEKKILFIDSDMKHYVVEQMLTKDIDIKMVESVMMQLIITESMVMI